MKSKMSEVTEVSSSAQKFVDRLLTEGSKIGCNDTDFLEKCQLPPFYDEKLFKSGQAVFHKHIFGMFIAKLFGLLSILADPAVLKILMLTKQSSTNFSAYVRYISTVFHMLIWYQEDFRPGSKLWKSMIAVTKKHSSASQKSCSMGFNKISQKDMAMTQFGFMGFQLCRGELVGIHNLTEEELKAFVHIWRVVGYLMGIDNKFNICNGSVEETKEICNLLIDRCLRRDFLNKHSDYLKMSSHLVGGLWSMNPVLIHEVMMNYLYLLLQPYSNKTNIKSIPNNGYFKSNIVLTIIFYYVYISAYLAQYNVFRYLFNKLQYLDLWFMEVWPILAYYSFGNKPNTLVKLKL